MPKTSFKNFSRRLTVRMPEDLYADLCRLSVVDEFHTLNDCIVKVLRRYVQEFGPDLPQV